MEKKMSKKQTELFDHAKEKAELLSKIFKQKSGLSPLKNAHAYLFGIFSEEEKWEVWKILKGDMECQLELIRSNRADVFPEKAFNYETLREIFANGAKNIIKLFVRSQFYREGMKQFLMSEKYRQLIKDKIGSKNYLEIMKEISKEN